MKISLIAENGGVISTLISLCRAFHELRLLALNNSPSAYRINFYHRPFCSSSTDRSLSPFEFASVTVSTRR
jgi:hypothetical protein